MHILSKATIDLVRARRQKYLNEASVSVQVNTSPLAAILTLNLYSLIALDFALLYLCAQQNGFTALMVAIQGGRRDISELLMDCGADLDLQDNVSCR